MKTTSRCAEIADRRGKNDKAYVALGPPPTFFTKFFVGVSNLQKFLPINSQLGAWSVRGYFFSGTTYVHNGSPENRIT
jgi:hypothetical protein